MAALAYIRLSKLCGFKPEDIADIYLMDSDNNGPLSGSLKQILGNQNIRNIRPIPVMTQLNDFQGMFHNAMFQDNIDNILKVLFEEKDMLIPVTSGMYGKPP